MKTLNCRSVEQTQKSGEKIRAGSFRDRLQRLRGNAKKPLAALLALIILCPAQSAWAASPPQPPDSRPPGFIEKQVTYELSDGLPRQPESIIGANGQEYRLMTVSAARPAPGSEHFRTYQVEIEMSIPAAQAPVGEADIIAAVESQYQIDQDGFAGPIELAEMSFDAVFVSYTSPVEKTLTFGGRSSADISDLPTSHLFTVSSDAALDATCQAELQRFAVSTVPESYEPDGRPASYISTVSFRGLESRLVLDHYKVQVSYQGIVPALIQMMTVTVVYQPVIAAMPAETEAAPLPPAVVPPDTAPPTPEPVVELPDTEVMAAVPLAAATIDLRLAFGLAATVLVTMLFSLLVWFLRPDARLLRREADGSERQLLARRLRRQGQLVVLQIPDDFDLDSIDAECYLSLRGNRYSLAESLEIRHRSRLLFKAKPAQRLEIGRQLVLAVAALLSAEEDELGEASAANPTDNLKPQPQANDPLLAGTPPLAGDEA